LEIAVIGMSGRFPGARNIDEFWENLKNGMESLRFFTEEELQETGVGPELLENSLYVKAGGGVLEDPGRRTGAGLVSGAPLDPTPGGHE